MYVIVVDVFIWDILGMFEYVVKILLKIIKVVIRLKFSDFIYVIKIFYIVILFRIYNFIWYFWILVNKLFLF